MNPVDLLCYLLSKKQTFMPLEFNQDDLGILKQLNYWDYTGKKDYIECDNCNGDTHNLMELPMGGVGYYCPEVAEVIKVDTEQQEYHCASLRIANIIIDIQKSLQLTKSPALLSKTNSIQETGQIKNIGIFDFYKQKAYAILVTRYQSIKDKEDIEYFIQSQIKVNRLYLGKIGFVFCANHTKVTAFEHGFYSIPLEAVTQIVNQTLCINKHIINRLLPLQHQSKILKSDLVTDILKNLMDNGNSTEQIMCNHAGLFYDTYRMLYGNDDVELKMIQRAVKKIQTTK